MVSTVFGLVIDLLRFIGFGLRFRARLAAENLFLRLTATADSEMLTTSVAEILAPRR